MIKKYLIGADFHVPFFNKKFLKLFLDVCKEADEIILLGDFMDFYSISTFDNKLSRADDLDYELTMGREILQNIRARNEKASIKFIKGNHCERMEKFLLRGKNRAISNLRCLDIDALLDFKKYNIELVESIKYMPYPNICFTHGSRVSLNPAQGEALSYMCSGFSGHCHRKNIFHRQYLNFKIEWYSLPCMCDIEQQYYAKYFNHQWSNGFCMAEIENGKIENVKFYEKA